MEYNKPIDKILKKLDDKEKNFLKILTECQETSEGYVTQEEVAEKVGNDFSSIFFGIREKDVKRHILEESSYHKDTNVVWKKGGNTFYREPTCILALHINSKNFNYVSEKLKNEEL